MSAADAISTATVTANTTGHRAWIIFVGGDLDVTQDTDIVKRSHIIECVFPTGFHKEQS